MVFASQLTFTIQIFIETDWLTALTELINVTTYFLLMMTKKMGQLI